MKTVSDLPAIIHIMDGGPQRDYLENQLNSYGFHTLSFSPRLSAEKGESPRLYVQRFLNHLPLNEMGLAYTVACGRRILGIPLTPEDAREMLTLLSGRRHQIWIGFGFKTSEKSFFKTVLTRISFKRLTAKEIDAYLLTDQWKERSGSYRAFGAAAAFLKSINGSPGALKGLPAFEFSSFLQTHKK